MKRVLQPLLKWKSNKYYIFRECVFVALGIQHAMRMSPTLICGTHYLIKGTTFEKVTEREMCVLIFSKTFV
jgi:hypothetical protein